MVYDGLDHVPPGRRAARCRWPARTRSTRSRSGSTSWTCSRARRCATGRAATGAGRSSRPRSTWRCARPAARSPTCSGASRGRSTSWSRCGSARWDATSPRRLTALLRLLERYPGTRFKLDPTNNWTPELVDELVATGAVDSLDLKGSVQGHAGRRGHRPRALPDGDRGVPGRLARGPGHDRRDAPDPRAGRATA